MTLETRLVDDMKLAMKQGETGRRDVIRLLRSAIKNREIDERGPLEEAQVVEVVQAQVKQRRDSIEAYALAGRADLRDKEQFELEVLLEYLPDKLKPLDEKALTEIVAEQVIEMGLSGPGDMRMLMPRLIEITGGRADNRLLSTLATAELRKRDSTESD